MKKLITLLFATFASLTVFGQVTEITPHPNDNFTYDGATLHHYGVGFHNYLDGLDGANLYGSGYFGIDFFTGGLHRLRITHNGLVGIGTNQPSSQLQVNASNLGAGFRLHGATGDNNSHTPYLILTGGYNTNSGIALRGVIDASSVGVGKKSMVFYSGWDIAGDNPQISDLKERMRICANGNIGIGTSTPQVRLHVSSSSINENSVNNNDANAIIEATGTTRTIGQGAALGFVVPANVDGSNPWQQGRILVTPDNTSNGNANGRMYIQTRYYTPGVWDWRNNLVLLSSGFVGIGTDKPDAMLTVNGTIHATEIKVDIAVPADYVFDPSYKLMPLSEVEKFVKEEKHLPEIPSAAEIKENGSNVGEMQNLLLQKVEELTLYVIEQQKLIAGQQNLLATQQAQLEELKILVGKKELVHR